MCRQVDLAIVLDSSWYITESQWLYTLTFAQELTARLALSRDCVRVSIVRFSGDVSVHKRFSDDVTQADVEHLLDDMRSRRSMIGQLLDLLLKEVYAGNGDRRDVINVVVAVFDDKTVLDGSDSSLTRLQVSTCISGRDGFLVFIFTFGFTRCAVPHT